MLKPKCGFVGIGAYGGNQVLPFYKVKYPSLFINTATTDLESLTEVDEQYKYQIPGGEGCNKDRYKSRELIRKDIDNIIKEVKEKFPGIEHLFIAASLGGGTGAGGVKALKRVAMNELDIKDCSIITTLPDPKADSIQALINSYETLAELEELEEPGTMFILDNSKNNNKMKINEIFFCHLDALLTLDCNSALGNIDDAEIEQMLRSRGCSIISKLGKDKSDLQNLLSTFSNNVYAPLEEDKIIKYIGLVNIGTGKGIRMEDIYAEVGTPLDTYVQYESAFTLCVLSGLSLPYKKMEEIIDIIDSNKDTIKRTLTAQNSNRLSKSIGFFDEITSSEKPTEKKKSSRDLLF